MRGSTNPLRITQRRMVRLLRGVRRPVARSESAGLYPPGFRDEPRRVRHRHRRVEREDKVGRVTAVQRNPLPVRKAPGDRLGRARTGHGDGPSGHSVKGASERRRPPGVSLGSASFCAVHAQGARRSLGSDTLIWAVPMPRGASRIEPGITPATGITLGPWAAWTNFETECGLSRLWGGVHFRAAIDEGRPLGRAIGEVACQFLRFPLRTATSRQRRRIPLDIDMPL